MVSENIQGRTVFNFSLFFNGFQLLPPVKTLKLSYGGEAVVGFSYARAQYLGLLTFLSVFLQ